MRSTPLLLAAFLLFAGCSTPAARVTPTPTPVHPQWIAYYVRGEATSANVTYRTGSGTSQAEVDLPLRNKAGDEGIQMTSDNAPDFLYISAQNAGEYGDVTCSIVIDGTVVSENTASGAYMIATCEYSR